MRTHITASASDHEALQDYCMIELGGKPMSCFLRGLIRRSVPELREKYARLAAAGRSGIPAASDVRKDEPQSQRKSKKVFLTQRTRRN